MQLYTSPDFIGHHPNFPVTGSHPTGGMHTKTAAIAAALDCEVITDIQDATGPLIVEPLAIKAPRSVPDELQHGGDWHKLREIEQQRITDVSASENLTLLRNGTPSLDRRDASGGVYSRQR